MQWWTVILITGMVNTSQAWQLFEAIQTTFLTGVLAIVSLTLNVYEIVEPKPLDKM